ncbi:phasin family protein [Halomonas sp. MCCC 1A11036]|uniref:Phasin family protein n=1 Tax=Billgrantia zhangzhouensis TaxID=2733481 RepID=A0ABS9AHF3_9GAMM|nr:phasin family protein [Halomonas zhangzhouensis]MCE8021193.1 phasin family protein [Halomonas zhangzhouensis]
MMKSFSFDTKPFEAMLLGPARAYAALSIDYTEKLFAAQLDAAKGYAEAGLTQARELLDVRDADALRRYAEAQQQLAKGMAERVKGDAEKIASLHQEFFQESQKLAQSSLSQAQQATSELAEKS